MAEIKKHGSVLAFGGLAAILASTCCLGPLVLVSLGFSGAWIGNLSMLEPYRPAFIVLAVVALLFGGWQIYRPAQDCAPGEVCAVPEIKQSYKFVFWVVASLTMIALAFPYVLPLFY
jgi:mercuric ion transport protein